jgi:hypothetical protein
MIAEIFRAALFAGLPVGVVSYLLFWWALRSEYLERTTNLKHFAKEVSRLSKMHSKNKKKNRNDKKGKESEAGGVKMNPVHNKWIKFGGGFYGVVALMTFVIVETGEIASFFGQFSENVGKLSQLSADMVINLIIDSLMNFVTAIAWPMYWMNRIETESIWIWFLVAYGGYWLGARSAIGFRDTEGIEP